MENDTLKFINWEWRPAVVLGYRAVVLARGDKHWSAAHIAEVYDSGREVDEKEFNGLFGNVLERAGLTIESALETLTALEID